MVARGWSEAKPPGGICKPIRILKGCESDEYVINQPLASLQDATLLLRLFQGGSLRSNPLATFFNPFGVFDLNLMPKGIRRSDERNENCADIQSKSCAAEIHSGPAASEYLHLV